MIAGFTADFSGMLIISSSRFDGTNLYPAHDVTQYTRSTPTANDFGIPIEQLSGAQTSALTQYSLVHIGIRDYTPNYPTQTQFIDDFFVVALSARQPTTTSAVTIGINE